MASYSLPVGRSIHATHGSTTLRRFDGPAAGELYLRSRSADGTAGTAQQAETLYDSLLDALAAEGFTPEALVNETVFFRSIDDDATAVLDARRRVLERRGTRVVGGMTTLIGQRPLDGSDRLEVAAVAIAPNRPGTISAADIHRTASCPCEACRAGGGARLTRMGEEAHFRAVNIHGVGAGAFEQAHDMFRVADALLGEAGMTFHDVIRTWIYLRDIDRDYHALNQARRDFFRLRGIERRPASTGVQGIPRSAAHDFSMCLYAVRSGRPLDVTLMSTPTLNEAWTYGAEFSRGLRVVDANKVTLHVSGTASIDEAGRTVHVGDFEAQVER
ncbi:MAG TPA: RidA family protein, partial [Candidatus Binatia bacterium]|nr:RidA family protein [Candidatus Binatia bacterium]